MFNKRIDCRYCQQTEFVKKHGVARSGYQRYYCSSCRRTFQAKYIYTINKKEETQSSHEVNKQQLKYSDTAALTI
ncbi:Transposase and inactivated derivatives [Leminorella richardii]|uniref:Transposase and inactivated derivatives n=1 Tax=Leminorella richardii TaxID=158841 RepID=A0A2X4UM61_9GAMM|nr:Transposase and inactivated derivatives [Leminorella richardii]